MRTIRLLVLFGLILVVGLAAVVYTGVYDIAADQPPSPVEDWIFGTVKHRSIEARAEGIEAPRLDDEALIDRGFALYDAACVVCHGGPGVWAGDFVMGLYPTPPKLDVPRVQAESDAELFWVIKNGLRHTGMPAFGPMHGDDDLWALVAFLRRLPQLGPEAYEALRGPPEAPAAVPEATAPEAGTGAAERL